MALLEVSGLVKTFGGLTAVSRLNFSVEQGRLVSIIGPNGAGKTTLFNLLTGIYRPTAGKVVFDGNDITGCKPYESAAPRHGADVPEDHCFPKRDRAGQRDHRPIRSSENGCLGGNSANGRGAARGGESPEEGALGPRVCRVWRTWKRGTAGSLTEEAQKRLSIAMVLAPDPKLLLLDEPTGGVNLEEIGGLIELVKKIQESGITVCLIEHKMRMVMSMSDRIIVLNYGTNIAEGTPAEVASNKEVIEAYLGARRVA